MPSPPKKKPGRPAKPEAERTGNFSVRMPLDLRGKLEAAAATARRSVNAEIVDRLETSFVEGSGSALSANATPAGVLLQRALDQLERSETFRRAFARDIEAYQGGQKKALAWAGAGVDGTPEAQIMEIANTMLRTYEDQVETCKEAVAAIRSAMLDKTEVPDDVVRWVLAGSGDGPK